MALLFILIVTDAEDKLSMFKLKDWFILSFQFKHGYCTHFQIFLATISFIIGLVTIINLYFKKNLSLKYQSVSNK